MSKQEFIQTPTFGKFAAIYVRVSQYEFSRDFKGQKQLRQSVITQKQDAINYCQDKGWSYRIYDQDSELSGSMLPDAEKGRKDLARLLKDIECGLIHTVVCRDIRRISRNTLLLTKLIHEHFIPYGVNLISLSENIDISTSYGRMFVSIMGEFAQIELHYHKTMGKRSIMAKLEEGRLATHPYCYGYKFYTRNHPEIVEEEATVIKKLFELKAYEKYTLGQLERFLIENIDATIIAQMPKMRPYIDQMRRNIADTLELDLSQVNVKATTEEGLGFTGTGEGISAQAICLLTTPAEAYSRNVTYQTGEEAVQSGNGCGGCSGCPGGGQ